MIKINVGCGAIRAAGWIGVDVDDHDHNVVGDAGRLGHLVTGVDVIVANHMLCQVPIETIPKMLVEWRSALRPGGIVRILVPDFLGAVAAFRRGDRAWFPNAADRRDRSLSRIFAEYVTWFGTNVTTFTPGLLEELVIEAGFRDVVVGAAPLPTRIAGADELDDRAGESIVVEAARP